MKVIVRSDTSDSFSGRGWLNKLIALVCMWACAALFWRTCGKTPLGWTAASLVFSAALFVPWVVLTNGKQALSRRFIEAGGASLFVLLFWLLAKPRFGESTVWSDLLVMRCGLFAVLVTVVTSLPARARRLLDALILIVFGFAVTFQIRSGIEFRDAAMTRAARQAKLGISTGPAPSVWQEMYDQPNRFLTVDTFRATATQTVAVGIAAMGMTMIIIGGGIDLSVGSVIALASVLTAWCLKRGWDPIPAALAGILLGALCGFANAGMITRLKVVPFIATLGMWGIARGLAKGIASEQKIDAPAGWLGTSVLARNPEPAWLLVSPGVWAMLGLAVLVWALLRYTALGRYIYAIGSNEATARLCGIRVERVKLYLYSIAGLTTGLAGVMQFCRLTVGDPTTAMGAELDVIAAVVIGGGSLAGGEGSVFGSLVGALIMAFLRTGCTQVGVPTWIQEMIIGAVIVLAVALDHVRRRSTAE